MSARLASQPDGHAVALVIPLMIYAAVFGLFAVGLYALMQPSQRPNPGLAAYTPPPATVIAFAPSSPARATEHNIGQVGSGEPADEPSTDGRAAHGPGARATIREPAAKPADDPTAHAPDAQRPRPSGAEATSPAEPPAVKPKRQKAKARPARQHRRVHDFAAYYNYRGFQPF